MKWLSSRSCYIFNMFRYKERLRRLYTDEDDMPAEDASFHIADVSSDTSAMNISQ